MAGLTKRECWTLAGLGVVALLFFGAGSKMAPGSSFKVPDRATEDVPPFTPPPGRPVLGPDQHVGGVVYTPHRYPPACGSDLTVAIHRGLTQLGLPAEGDMLWLSNPPGEENL
jgi:hypothetical protein